MTNTVSGPSSLIYPCRTLPLLLAIVSGWVHPVAGQQPANVRRAPQANAAHHRWAQNSAARLGFTPLHQQLRGDASGVVTSDRGEPTPAQRTSAPHAQLAAFGQTTADSMDNGGRAISGPPTSPPTSPGPAPLAPQSAPNVSQALGADQFSAGEYEHDEIPHYVENECEGCQTGGPCQIGCDRRWWVRTNYLHWWTKGAEAPPLLTTSSDTSSSTTAAVLGDPDTRILYGNGSLHDGSRSGFELELGMKISPWGDRTLQVRYLFVGEDEATFATSSDRLAVLGRPFLDVETGDQAASLIGFPNLVDGNITLDATSKFSLLDAVGDNIVCSSCNYLHHWQLGYRMAQLDDSLTIDQNVVARGTQAGLATGTTLAVNDRIRTNNEFHGVVLGWSTEVARFPWVVELRARSALGNTDAAAELAGTTTTTVPNGTPVTTSNGLLVQPTNDGVFSDSRFAILPEFGLQLHRDYACGARLTFGYSFLYWSNVLRAVEQIDTKVNQSQLPPGPLDGAPLPEYTFRFTDFWAQGATIGCEFRY